MPRTDSMIPALTPSLSIRLVCACVACLATVGMPGCDKSKNEAPAAKVEPSKPADGADKSNLKYGLTPEQAAQVLVEVGDTKITLGEFAERLGSQSPYLRARYNSPERRREFLENMVRFELLAAEADRRGFTKSEDVERVRRQVMVQQMMADLFDKGGIKLTDITDEEIKAYYDAHLSEFDKPAQVRASHILFKDRTAAEQALKELKAKPQDQELFRKIAEQRSLDSSTKASGGDLRFFSDVADPQGETDEPERPAAVRKAAFSLANVGDLYAEPVQSERGFHVVKLTGRREALKRTLDDARRMIQNKLWRSKRESAIEKFVADLRSKANVQENPEALAKVQVKDALGNVASPGGSATSKGKPEAAAKPPSDKAKPAPAH
ncbi:MAG TPA: peptidyl-prolyl cis-trans isomerase [Polyangiales bacterium]|nr:peptidyl-prolyl cis-trans isomerase [Polyangiales bacterium]